MANRRKLTEESDSQLLDESECEYNEKDDSTPVSDDGRELGHGVHSGSFLVG